ncbi:unnamed protein product [Cochlearia groenlandica]
MVGDGFRALFSHCTQHELMLDYMTHSDVKGKSKIRITNPDGSKVFFTEVRYIPKMTRNLFFYHNTEVFVRNGYIQKTRVGHTQGESCSAGGESDVIFDSCSQSFEESSSGSEVQELETYQRAREDSDVSLVVHGEVEISGDYSTGGHNQILLVTSATHASTLQLQDKTRG